MQRRTDDNEPTRSEIEPTGCCTASHSSGTSVGGCSAVLFHVATDMSVCVVASGVTSVQDVTAMCTESIAMHCLMWLVHFRFHVGGSEWHEPLLSEYGAVLKEHPSLPEVTVEARDFPQAQT